MLRDDLIAKGWAEKSPDWENEKGVGDSPK